MVGGASIGGVAAIFKLASLLPKRVIFAYGGLGLGAAALSFPRLSFQESFLATMAILAALRVPREVAPAVASGLHREWKLGMLAGSQDRS